MIYRGDGVAEITPFNLGL